MDGMHVCQGGPLNEGLCAAHRLAADASASCMRIGWMPMHAHDACASACCFEARRLFEATNSSAFSQACTTRASITCKVSGSAAQDRTVDSRVRGGVEELQCRCCTLAKPAPYVD